MYRLFTTTSVMRYLFFVLVMSAWISNGVAEKALAQDKMLDLLPYEEGLYIWSDDVPAMLEQLKKLAPENLDQWQQLVDPQSDEDEKKATAVLKKHRLQQLIDLASIWEQLESDELFPGEAGLISIFDEAGNPSLMLVAKCESEQAEVSRFVDSLAALFVPASSALRSDDSEKEREGPNKLSNQWRLQNGWFVLGSEPETLDTVMGFLSGETKATSTLADDRTFKRSFAQLRNENQGRAALSVYATAGAMPFVGEFFASNSDIVFNVGINTWEDYYLDSIRGLAVRLYVHDENLLDDASAKLGADGFLIVTQPRRGVLRSIGVSPKSVFPTTQIVPLLALGRYGTFAFDGEELRKGMVEIALKDARDKGVTDPDELDQAIESQRELDLMRVVSGITEIQFFDSDAETRRPRSGFMCVQINDPKLFDESFTEMTQGQMEKRPLNSFGEPYNQLDYEGAYAWGQSEEALEQTRESFRSQIEHVRKQIEELEQLELKADDRAAREQQLRSILASQESALEQMVQQQQPAMVVIDDWFYTQLGDARAFSYFSKGFERQHPQLLVLEEDIQNMRKAFGAGPPNAGVYALWGDTLANQLSQSGNPRIMNAPAAYAEQLESAQDSKAQVPVRPSPEELQRLELSRMEVQQRKKVSEMVLRQFERVVVTIASTSDGFRFNGIVIQDPLGDPNDSELDESK